MWVRCLSTQYLNLKSMERESIQSIEAGVRFSSSYGCTGCLNSLYSAWRTGEGLDSVTKTLAFCATWDALYYLRHALGLADMTQDLWEIHAPLDQKLEAMLYPKKISGVWYLHFINWIGLWFVQRSQILISFVHLIVGVSICELNAILNNQL